MLGQVRAEGQYINDKIDLLVQYLLVDPFQSLYSRVFKHKARICTHQCSQVLLNMGTIMC